MNSEKYRKIFIESLGIEESSFKESIKYNEIPEWDSSWPYDTYIWSRRGI